jgi:predicted RNA-binding Zn-ribbon protein involved in translation (DUF1610 family)
LIYLKGVSYEHLENALKFIYLGQVDVRDDDISAFMATVVDLGITGLMEEPEKDTEVSQEVMQKKTSLPDPEYYQADLKVEILTTNNQRNRAPGDQPGGETHFPVPAVRQDDGRFRCDMCDKEYRQRGDLTRHRQIKHEGVRYGCDQCDYKATQKGHLNEHKQSQHEGVSYSCDQCDYKASYLSHLITHKQSLHDGVRYSCDQCDYKATEKSSLSRHKRRIHYKESLSIV